MDAQHELHERAYAAMERGELSEASRCFESLLARSPDSRFYHYMRGLAHKYLFDWPTSLRHNLRAIDLCGGECEGEHWNAAIAATALGDWDRVRALWTACGVSVPEGRGPIDDNYGIAVVRLNPWHGGETVWGRRIDPVRARLLNVPLPESGHRFGDIVLHDGAPTGWRWDGDRKATVFNELQRLEPSHFETHVVFVRCERNEDLKVLLDTTAPGIGFCEDWTKNVRHYCLRCSFGTPHSHERTQESAVWEPERNLGVAAQSRRSVEKLLREWSKGGRGREIESIERRECAVPAFVEGHVWWQGPEAEAEPPGVAG
ncbi:MAG: hypothetical protein J0L88_05285 [Xanthomonadales bacterium]|nr:hypothetical protein [Xanthomonadales bacterium]